MQDEQDLNDTDISPEISKKLTCLIAIGTRPEAIKMAPLIRKLKEDDRFDCKVCSTGQHEDMFDSVLEFFNITSDFKLETMQKGQDLCSLFARINMKVGLIIKKTKPDLILVHGDTASTLACSLAAYYNQVPIIHVEAGLRSYDLKQPWPEEAHRRLVSIITESHFAPTAAARENLISEGIPDDKICVTGNTAIDALMLGLAIIDQSAEWKEKIANCFQMIDPQVPLILVTVHRRENHGAELKQLAKALLKIAAENSCNIAIPIHPNPNVKNVLVPLLKDKSNIHMFDPLCYPFFISLMNRSAFIMTDSGGIQEEAPSLGKPVIVLRNKTERSEGLQMGYAKLCSMDEGQISKTAKMLLDDQNYYNTMVPSTNPYGDGNASAMIIKNMTSLLNRKNTPDHILDIAG